MDTYQYTVIHANELEILKCCIRFSFAHIIVRKNGISCEVLRCLFFRLFINASFTSLSSVSDTFNYTHSYRLHSCFGDIVSI